MTDLPSPEMRRVYDLVARVAPTDATVLVTGESGVGKEDVARRLHERSCRARGPLVAVNCAALTDSLLETELFGHLRGAFTGAVQDRLGLVEAAHTGTLFLDEIGDVSPAVQVRLLRILQTWEVRRVGDFRSRHVDVRLVAATNRDLAAEVRLGRFRLDLYYRLSVVDVTIPPLRQRPADVQHLLDERLDVIARRMGRSIAGYSAGARQVALEYSWPGNIRELEHAIVRACALARGPFIETHDFPDAVRQPFRLSESGPIKPLRELEREYVRMVLRRNDGDRRRAAAELQISLATLKRKLVACPR
jgi:two-component system response regulator HydG